MIGQLLAGHYKVLKVLGEGGFGQTYIVEDIHLPASLSVYSNISNLLVPTPRF